MVCIGEQMDTSILTTLHLVALGIPKVIAKATSAEHGLILEKLGAEVVYPERDMAVRLASRLETTRELDIIQLSEQINISKIQLPEQFVGKSVADVNLQQALRAEYHRDRKRRARAERHPTGLCFSDRGYAVPCRKPGRLVQNQSARVSSVNKAERNQI